MANCQRRVSSTIGWTNVVSGNQTLDLLAAAKRCSGDDAIDVGNVDFGATRGSSFMNIKMANGWRLDSAAMWMGRNKLPVVWHGRRYFSFTARPDRFAYQTDKAGLHQFSHRGTPPSWMYFALYVRVCPGQGTVPTAAPPIPVTWGPTSAPRTFQPLAPEPSHEPATVEPPPADRDTNAPRTFQPLAPEPSHEPATEAPATEAPATEAPMLACSHEDMDVGDVASDGTTLTDWGMGRPMSNGMNGWVTPSGSSVVLGELPHSLLFAKTMAYFPPNSNMLDSGGKIRVECPDNCQGESCQVFVVNYECGRCSINTNGGLSDILPAAGWNTQECYPTFTSGGNQFPTIVHQKFVKHGAVLETPLLTTGLRNVAVIVRTGALNCDDLTTEASCVNRNIDYCKWENGKCSANWCRDTEKRDAFTNCSPCI